MVQELRYFLHKNYTSAMFESCREVTNPSMGPVMSMLCGGWGDALCTDERLVTHLGSTSNGFSPFNIVYDYGRGDQTLSDDGRHVYHNPSTTACNEGVNVSGSFYLASAESLNSF